jgi:hypothetical protein
VFKDGGEALPTGSREESEGVLDGETHI